MAWNDYTETRAIVALIFTAAVIVALFTRYITGGEFVAALTTIIGCFTAHSLLDDKFPDRNITKVDMK